MRNAADLAYLVRAPGVYPFMMAEIVKYSVLYWVPTRPMTFRTLLLRNVGRYPNISKTCIM